MSVTDLGALENVILRMIYLGSAARAVNLVDDVSRSSGTCDKSRSSSTCD